MNRTYELMFIVRPDMVEEEQDKLISTLETAVTSSGGNVKSVEKMGKRRLAYMVRRFHDGIYVLLTVEGGGGLIHELERRLSGIAGLTASVPALSNAPSGRRSERAKTRLPRTAPSPHMVSRSPNPPSPTRKVAFA